MEPEAPQSNLTADNTPPSPEPPVSHASSPFYKNKIFLIILSLIILLVIIGGISVMNMQKTFMKSEPTSTPKPTMTPIPTNTPIPISSPSATPSSTTGSTTVSPLTPTPATTMTFQGSAQIKAGELASPGVPLEALINGKVCGMTYVGEPSDASINFAITIKSDAQLTGCGRPGDTVTFKIDGQTAQQTIPFNTEKRTSYVILNISY